jgi:hypothetical protein
MRSLCILIVDLSVAVNSVKPLGVAMETQNCTPALFSSYITFPTAIKQYVNVLTSLPTALDIVVRHYPYLEFTYSTRHCRPTLSIFGVSRQIFVIKSPASNPTDIVQ